MINTPKTPACPNRPSHGGTINLKHRLHFIKQLHWITTFTIKLINESHNRRTPQTANLHQFDRALLHSLGNIDDHQRRINGRQCPVGVLRKVLVARRIQQIDDPILIDKLHDRRGHRNTSLLFQFHPIRGRITPTLASPHGTRQLYRTA